MRGKRRFLLLLTIALICALTMLYFTAMEGSASEQKSLEIPLLKTTESGKGVRITDGKPEWFEEEQICLIQVDLREQMYQISRIRLAFSTDEPRVVLLQDEHGSEIEWVYCSRELEFDVPRTVACLCFPATQWEADSIAVTGVIAPEDMEEKIQRSEGALSGKKLSVIGDSLSAYAYFVPNGLYAHYPQGDVSLNDMWWYHLAKELDMEICRISACAGSGVVVSPQGADESIAQYMVGTAYCRQLHSGENRPDIIVIWIGGNDVLSNVSRAEITQNYQQIVREVREEYPQAGIWLCTYGWMCAFDEEGFAWLNEEIKRIAQDNGACVAEIHLDDFRQQTQDVLHLNASGHEAAAEQIKASILLNAADTNYGHMGTATAGT